MDQSLIQLVRLINLALSTFRLTKLINDDYLLKDIRNLIWEKYPRDTKIGYLFSCPWCMSIWMAFGLILLEKASPELYKEVTSILTASAVVGIISERL